MRRTNKYQEISEARNLLELSESATLDEIKSNYRALLTRWHPDRCTEGTEICNEMTRKVIASYKTIIAYCNEYKYSFSEEEVKKYLSPEEWWYEHFGDDPLWGNGPKP